MEHIFFVLHMYVTRILLVTCLAYTFLTHGCPTCPSRLELGSPAFFLDEQETMTDHKALQVLNGGAAIQQEIETECQEESHA